MKITQIDRIYQTGSCPTIFPACRRSKLSLVEKGKCVMNPASPCSAITVTSGVKTRDFQTTESPQDALSRSLKLLTLTFTLKM